MDRPYHTLLRRQLKKIFGESFSVPEEWQRFVEAVNAAYHESDIDRNMLERSLELSSQELLQKNSEMRVIAQNLENEVEKRAKALEESELRYRELYENIIDMVILVDRDNHIQMANPRFYECTGIPDTELLDITFMSIVYPDDAPLVEVQMMAKLIEERDVEDFQFRILKREGVTLDVECNAHVIRKDDKLIGFQMVIRDITARKRAAEVLQESEEQHRNLLENANEAIFVAQDGMLVFINQMTTMMFDYSAEELALRPFVEFIHPDDRGMVIDRHSRRIKGEDLPPRYTFRIIPRDGSIRWVELNTVLINWKQKPATLNFMSDITDRKQAEEALRESEVNYRQLYDSSPSVIYQVDYRTGKFLKANDVFCDFAGCNQEEITSLSPYDLLTDKSKQLFLERLNKMSLGEKVTETPEYEVIDKNGRRWWLQLNCRNIYDSEGLMGAYIVAHDITERKHAEEQLLKSEEKYRNILENMEDSYFEVDLAGNITFLNQATVAVLGYPKEEIMGTNYRKYMDLENSKKVFQSFHKIYVTGIPTKGVEWEVIQKNGVRKQIEVAISLIVNPGEKPSGFRCIGRDITERKMIEQIEHAKLRAEAANKAKGQFLATMSHEIRTPLNGILGMAEVCLETELSEEQKHIVGTIKKEADSLLEIINEILDFSKIEAGKLELERIAFDLRNLFEDVAQSFSFQITQIGLELISSISPETPTRIIGDPGRLRQILRNLIGNAIKFTPEGRIVVKAEPVQDLGDRIKLRFLVKDTGIGIPREKQSIIFESFTQADGSTTRKYGGTGLGVTICKQLTELMSGEIGVDSEEGKGTTFCFTAIFSKQKEMEFPKIKEGLLDKVKMLIVDDNKAGRQLMAEFIMLWGAIPVEAANAKEALSILRKTMTGGERIDLILSDFNMPGMNGFALAKEIRSMESFRSIPIIIITGYGNLGDGKLCRDIGIEGYLTKPVREKELRQTIEKVLCLSMNIESSRDVGLVTKYTAEDTARQEIRILLAEDYPTNQEIARRHLEHAGYQVDLAENGMLAVEAFKRKYYDLILMDVEMPVMDGYQATKAIREIEAEIAAMGNENTSITVRRVPIIALTAHALSEYKSLSVEAGMDDFLTKPLTRKELLAMAEKWVDLQSKTASGSGGAFLNSPLETGQDVPPMEVWSGKPIDLDRAIDEFEGDRVLLAEVIADFTAKVGEQIGAIREALSCGDAETVRREAHSIKGGALNLTAEDLAGKAFMLESKGKSKELNGAGEIMDSLEQEFKVLKQYIRENLM